MLPFQEPARGEQAEAAETEKTQRWKGAAAWLEDEAGEGGEEKSAAELDSGPQGFRDGLKVGSMRDWSRAVRAGASVAD